MTSATVSGYFDHNVLTIVDRSDTSQSKVPVARLWKVRAKQVVLATGAIEQPLVFDYNDRPGIMLASAMRKYVGRQAVIPGRRVVLATNNDEAYRTAFVLHDLGVEIPAIVDTRRDIGDTAANLAERRGIRIHREGAVSETRGLRGVSSISLKSQGAQWEIACDALAVSGGWNPTLHLYSQAGGTIRYDEQVRCFKPKECRQSVRVAGAANGIFNLPGVLESGWQAGQQAAADAGCAVVVGQSPVGSSDDLSYEVVGTRLAGHGNVNRQWVDLQHDVTVSDLELAVRENFVSVEHLKRYTTVGMAVDQGKTSNLNALTVLSELTGKPVAQVGTTTFRPPYTPIPMGILAGSLTNKLYSPMRLVPCHAWHERAGAVFDDYGGWRRPAWYMTNGDRRDDAIVHEVLTVRSKVGLFDASPLGKFEIVGPDAAEFLNRVYLNNVVTLKPGYVRYGLMLSENGIVMDDGIVACIGRAHYLINTTAANCNRVATWLDAWHQCEWPELDVVILPVTTQWAVLTLSGPGAREVLKAVSSDLDVANESFPSMTVRQGVVAGRRSRIQRVSFGGEVSYEISVSADDATEVIEAIVSKGEPFGLAPVGLEAMLVLRMEKGFLHVGSDTDGTTNPMDVGYAELVSRKRCDYIGRRSLLRPHDQRATRRQLVGIEAEDGRTAFAVGTHIVSMASGNQRSEGFVTSACVSPTLGKPIGLAMLEGGQSRKGEIVQLFDQGVRGRGRIVDRVFYDLKGERIRG